MKFHIALSVADLDQSIEDYSQRLQSKPCCVVQNEYALWRTEFLNFSIKLDPENTGKLRHLGFEDQEAVGFNSEYDVNDILWECFNADTQTQEIFKHWPNAIYHQDEYNKNKGAA